MSSILIPKISLSLKENTNDIPSFPTRQSVIASALNKHFLYSVIY